MFNLSNGITILRAPLAFCFLIDNSTLRVIAITLAMFTDSIDGYLARKLGHSSQLGAILDPIMDKFFTCFVLTIFLIESKLTPWQACAMLSRDFSLCVFAIYLGISDKWNAFQVQSIRWGKITTSLQFFVLIMLSLNYPIPLFIFILFVLFGILAFIELCRIKPIVNIR